MELPSTTGFTTNSEVRRPMSIEFLPILTGTSRLQVIWFGNDGSETILADTIEGYRVLETTLVSFKQYAVPS